MSHQEILLCKYVEHKSKEIQMICVNEKCDKVKPGCLDCLKQFHKQHLDDMLDFQEFNNWRIDKVKIIEDIKLQIQELETATQMLKQFIKLNVVEPNYNILSQTTEQINAEVRHFIQLKMNSLILQDELNLLSSVLIKLKTKFKEIKLNQGIQFIVQLNEQKVINLPKLSQEIKIIEQEHQKQQYLFSEISKNQFVTISKQGKIAQGAGFCMSDTPIPDKGVTRFNFQIINKGVGLSIGVCIKDIVSLVNYRVDISKKEHGCYLISESGYSYSHHQQEMNKVFKTFKFFDDEIITVQVDNINKSITWTSNQSGKKFDLQFENAVQLYPCVDLDYDGKVEIMDYDINN